MVLFGAVASFDLVWNLVDFFMGYFVTFSIFVPNDFLVFLQSTKNGHLDVDVWTLSKYFFSWLGNRVKIGNAKN